MEKHWFSTLLWVKLILQSGFPNCIFYCFVGQKLLKNDDHALEIFFWSQIYTKHNQNQSIF